MLTARSLASVLIVAAFLELSGCTQVDEGRTDPDRSAVVSMSVQPAVAPTAQPMIPGTLFNPSLDLRAGPVDVPLELRIPSLQIIAPVVGVGITAENVMDVPQGMTADPVWHKVFWYRGSGVPGEVGTATLAGHVNDLLGRPAVFARLRNLQTGDLIIIHDTRSGLDVHFTVAKITTYSIQEVADPSILAQIYGNGPVSGKGPQPAPDGLAHLTLITCTGGFVNGSYDHRLIVYATHSESKQFQFNWKQ